MIPDLTCLVERDFPVALVRLCGRLDRRTSTQARTALSRCLAEQPTALVIDLAELSVSDDLVLGLLRTLAERAVHWPGAAILLCAANPEVTAALGRVAGPVPFFATRAAAMDEAGRQPVPPRVRQVYPPAIEAPQHARTLVAGACTAWGVPGAVSTAQLVASELVANAVVHARTPLELSLMLREPYLHLAVRDGDERTVRQPGQVSDHAEHGRGLLVIDALATTWGTIHTGDGKVVWATLKV